MVFYMILSRAIIMIVVVVLNMILLAAGLTIVVDTSVANGHGGYKLGSRAVPGR